MSSSLKSGQTPARRAAGYLTAGFVVSLVLRQLCDEVASYSPNFGWAWQDVVINLFLYGCLAGLVRLAARSAYRRVRARNRRVRSSSRRYAFPATVPRHLLAALSFYLFGLAFFYGYYRLCEWSHSLPSLGCGSGSRKAWDVKDLVPWAAYFLGGVVASMTADRVIRVVAMFTAYVFPWVLAFGLGELNLSSACFLMALLVLMSLIFILPWVLMIGELSLRRRS